MKNQPFDDALVVDKGALTLTSSSLGGLFQDFLTNTYGGPLTISGATKKATGRSVTVDGTAPLLHVASLPVHAEFTQQQQGDRADATITWSLPQSWMFANSFPALPAMGDSSPLHGLVLTNSRFVAATSEAKERSGPMLVAGLNFVSDVTPSGTFGMFRGLLRSSGPYTMNGSVILPRPGELMLPLPPLNYPWQPSWRVPGLHLSVPLGVDLLLGSIRIHGLALRIYTPVDAAWLAANETYLPIVAVTGTLDIGSGIAGAMTAVLEPDGSGLVLDCDFSGATVDKLEKLSDLFNGPDLASILPRELQSALGSIALERASIGLSGLSGSGVEFVSLKVGLPNARWQILSSPVSIAVGSLGAYFSVVSPFGKRLLAVTFEGEVSVGGATFDVLTSYPGFAARLDLLRDTTVPLRQIFSTLAPGLPAPPDLTIDEMQLEIVPGSGYAFSARMADDPRWTLDLGPASVSIGSVAVDIENMGGSGVSGSFSGNLMLPGGVELDMRYDTPGAFVIRADVPEARLSQLIGALDQIGVALPSGFDIELKQACALIEQDKGAFTFSAAGLIEGFGLVGFTAKKTTAWGFAFGVAMESGALSSIPGLSVLSAIESFIGLEKLMIVVSSLDQVGFRFPTWRASMRRRCKAAS
ncbi:MAG: hypothetical protein ACJ76J_07405 [Thermoanaerobaculia bacterium]